MEKQVSAHLAARYGTAKTRRRDRLALGIIGSILVLLIAVFFGSMFFARSYGSLEFNVQNYEIVDPAHSEITFELITAKPNTAVQCTVEAISESKAPVGYTTIEIAPSTKLRQIITAEVRTTAHPAAVSVDSCRATKN